jgi:hypothetical protein
MTLSLYQINTKEIWFVGFSIVIDRTIEKETLLRTSPHSSISSSSWSPILSPLKHDLRYHFRKKTSLPSTGINHISQVLL